MHADVSQVRDFARKLEVSRRAKEQKVRATTKKAAQNIKTDVLEDLKSSGNKAFRHIPVAYEMRDREHTVIAEIAPVLGGAGNLDNLAFFGTARGGGTHDFYGHAQAEFPHLCEAMRKAMFGWA